MSLVQGLLTQLQQLAQEHRKSKVITVSMEIGPFAGVVVDSFQFGFEILAKENALTENTALKIRCPPARYRCFGCGKQIEEQRPDCCPVCFETLFSSEGSDDVLLLQVEME